MKTEYSEEELRLLWRRRIHSAIKLFEELASFYPRLNRPTVIERLWDDNTAGSIAALMGISARQLYFYRIMPSGKVYRNYPGDKTLAKALMALCEIEPQLFIKLMQDMKARLDEAVIKVTRFVKDSKKE